MRRCVVVIIGRFRMVILGFWVVVGRLWMVIRRFMMRCWVVVRLVVGCWVFGWPSIALTTFAVNSPRMITSAQVFIENCAISAVKGVLFAVRVAKMVNLQ